MSERHILLITADRDLPGLFSHLAARTAADVTVCTSVAEGARELARSPYDVLFVETDTLYPEAEEPSPAGPSFAERPPVVAFSKEGCIQHAVRAMRAGACDYLPRPPGQADELRAAVNKALRCANGEAADDGSRTGKATAIEGFMTKDHRLLAACRVAAEVANSCAPLLIEGERGTGKSFLAKKVHEHSSRVLGSFVEVRCDTLGPSGLEVELFGAGSERDEGGRACRGGRIHDADGGTLLLDYVTKAPPSLLSAVVSALGLAGGKGRSNARLMLADGVMGGGLMRRLRGDGEFDGIGPVKVHLPPLRERVGDVPLLARYFVKGFSGESGGRRIVIGRGAMEKLVHHDWPGNVKELKEVVRLSVLQAREGVIGPEAVPLPPGKDRMIRGKGGGSRLHVKPLKTALQGPEREYILEVLRRMAGNKQRAAQELRISRSTLYKKIKKYGLDGAGKTSVGPPSPVGHGAG